MVGRNRKNQRISLGVDQLKCEERNRAGKMGRQHRSKPSTATLENNLQVLSLERNTERSFVMSTICEKVLMPRSEPSWLMSVTAVDAFPLHLVLKDSLYYPASGLDGDPIRHLGGYIHSFVYTDYSVGETKIAESLVDPKHQLKGYRLIFSKNVSETVFGSSPPYEQNGSKAATLPYALWAVLERLNEFGTNHGPRRLSFLFIGGEAVQVFKHLYIDNGETPEVVAIIHCGIGWGGVCNDLADRRQQLAQDVLDHCARQPRFVLYGVRYRPCRECCWPEYTHKVATWPDGGYELGLWWKPTKDILAAERLPIKRSINEY